MGTMKTSSTVEATSDLATVPKTMVAASRDLVSGEFRTHQIPVPRPMRSEVLVRVRAAGVCLSDVHIIDRSLRGFKTRDDQTVITMGHEIAGTIAAIGPDVPAIWHVDARVIRPICRRTRRGGSRGVRVRCGQLEGGVTE